MARPGGILLQVGPSSIDIDREYRGGGVVEEVEENESGDVSIDSSCSPIFENLVSASTHTFENVLLQPNILICCAYED